MSDVTGAEIFIIQWMNNFLSLDIKPTHTPLVVHSCSHIGRLLQPYWPSQAFAVSKHHVQTRKTVWHKTKAVDLQIRLCHFLNLT